MACSLFSFFQQYKTPTRNPDETPQMSLNTASNLLMSLESRKYIALHCVISKGDFVGQMWT